MFPWTINFHDDNMVNKDCVFWWTKYDITKDGEIYYVYDEFKPRQYAVIRIAVQKMYIELSALSDHKKEDQFKHWMLFKDIGDYTL